MQSEETTNGGTTVEGASTYERTEIPKETFVEFLLMHSQRTTNKNK